MSLKISTIEELEIGKIKQWLRNWVSPFYLLNIGQLIFLKCKCVTGNQDNQVSYKFVLLLNCLKRLTIVLLILTLETTYFQSIESVFLS
jgi:hypothetical protein